MNREQIANSLMGYAPARGSGGLSGFGDDVQKITPEKLKVMFDQANNPPPTKAEYDFVKNNWTNPIAFMKFTPRQKSMWQLYVQAPLLANKYNMTIEDVWLGRAFDVSREDHKKRARKLLLKEIASAAAFVIGAISLNPALVISGAGGMVSGGGAPTAAQLRSFLETGGITPDAVNDNLFPGSGGGGTSSGGGAGGGTSDPYLNNDAGTNQAGFNISTTTIIGVLSALALTGVLVMGAKEKQKVFNNKNSK